MTCLPLECPASSSAKAAAASSSGLTAATTGYSFPSSISLLKTLSSFSPASFTERIVTE